MPNAFNFSASPFDCLTSEERQLVRQNVNVGYYPAGEVLLAPHMQPTHLFILIKGHVVQWDGEERVSTYGPDDCFDGRALLAGKVSDRFVAAEEVVTYELRQQAVTELIASNAGFGALLFSDLGQRLSALSQRQDQHQLHALTLARVDEAYLRPAREVDAGTDIVSVSRILHQEQTNNVLVRDSRCEPPRLGIFTVAKLAQAILDGRPLDRLPVGDLADYPLLTVQRSDQIGDAMTLMLSHRAHRVVVLDAERIVGVLESLDLFSFLSNHSHLITVQIEQAQDLPALAQAPGLLLR